MKIKTCSFCGKTTERLFYSKPKCCSKHSCKKKYHEEKKKDTPTSDGEGKAEPRQYSRQVGRKAIKPISDKQAQRLKEYRRVRDVYMKNHPVCECCQATPSQDLHHMAGRVGDNLTNPNYFLAVCRACHQEIEINPTWAKENGYSLSRLSDEPTKNQDPSGD